MPYEHPLLKEVETNISNALETANKGLVNIETLSTNENIRIAQITHQQGEATAAKAQTEWDSRRLPMLNEVWQKLITALEDDITRIKAFKERVLK